MLGNVITNERNVNMGRKLRSLGFNIITVDFA